MGAIKQAAQEAPSFDLRRRPEVIRAQRQARLALAGCGVIVALAGAALGVVADQQMNRATGQPDPCDSLGLTPRATAQCLASVQHGPRTFRVTGVDGHNYRCSARLGDTPTGVEMNCTNVS